MTKSVRAMACHCRCTGSASNDVCAIVAEGKAPCRLACTSAALVRIRPPPWLPDTFVRTMRVIRGANGEEGAGASDGASGVAPVA